MIELKFSGDLNAIRTEVASLAALLGFQNPLPAAAAEEPKKARAKKSNGEAAAENPPSAPVVQSGNKTPPPAPVASVQAPPPPAVPSDQEVQNALVAVSEKHGIEKAIECLGKFNVKRGRELTDAQKQPFVDHCKSLLA